VRVEEPQEDRGAGLCFDRHSRHLQRHLQVTTRLPGRRALALVA
jgi:hypothetical protein